MQVASCMTLGTCLLTLILGACTDDLSVKTDTTDAEQLKPGITIRIPNIEGSAFTSTRTDEVNASLDEAKVNDLWLVVCSGSTTKVYELLNKRDDKQNSNLLQGDKYTSFTIDDNQLDADDYKIYVFGNIEDYLPANSLTEGTSTTLKEATIESWALDFSDLLTAENSDKLQLGNLPMACLPKEMNGRNGTSVDEDGKINFQKGDVKEVEADLTFLCSKVRYTILFDNTESGFSNKFTDVIDFNTRDAIANKVRNSTKIVYDNDKDFNAQTAFLTGEESFGIPLNKVKYPTEEDYPTGYPNYDSEDSSTSPDLEKRVDDWSDSDHQRAWQGTVYLPENRKEKETTAPLSEADITSGNLTYLKFPTTTEGKNYYSLISQWNEGKYSGIKRGNFYDVVAKISTPDKVEITTSVSVHDWTLKQLLYELMGPTELIVETTELTMYSGKWSTLWFRSNIAPEDIDFDFPIIDLGGEIGEVPFFEAEVVEDSDAEVQNSDSDLEIHNTKSTSEVEGRTIILPQAQLKTRDSNQYATNDNGDYMIRVRINPVITLTKLLELLPRTGTNLNGTGNIKEYNFFEIVAGNLHKKIKLDISNENIKAYLNVSPTNIIIDVREFINSGLEETTIDIEYETNIEEGTFTLKYEGDNIIENTENPLWITLEEGITWANNTDFSLSPRNGVLTLNIKDLREGNEYWKSTNYYTLTFEVTYSDSSDGGFEKTITVPVTITVKPFSTDYVIHFKTTDNTHPWYNPHIYIYQCLTLPSDLKQGDDYYEFRGKTVGFDSNNPKAGLEYSFTNNVSFRGWSGYGGIVNPIVSGSEFKDGFVFLGGATNDFSNKFNPEGNNSDIYNYSTDLNSAHAVYKDFWMCDKCQAFTLPGDYNAPVQPGMNRLFGGISMEREYGENEGWYKYTLSGVATPGKALIIFFNGHVWSDLPGADANDYKEKKQNELYYRYPAKDPSDADPNSNNPLGTKDTSGIPLFDYPDNEGWFLFDGNGQNFNQYFTDEKPKMYRLYWPITLGNNIHLYPQGLSNQDFTAWDYTNDISRHYGQLDLSLGYFYFDIPKIVGTTLVCSLPNTENIEDNVIGPFSSFTLHDNNYCAYIVDENGTVNFSKPKSLWTLSDDTSDEIYLRGDINSWNKDELDEDYKFQKVASNTWISKKVTIPANTGFKIGTPNWDDEKEGVFSLSIGFDHNAGDNVVGHYDINWSYDVDNHGGSKNMFLNEDFTGYVVLSSITNDNGDTVYKVIFTTHI